MTTRRSAGQLASAVLALALLGLGGCTSPAAPVPSPATSAAPAKVALGYYAGDDPVVYSSVTSFASYINAVSAARFEITATGEVTGTLPNTDLLPFDKANGIHTYAGVYDSAGNGFDGKLAHAVMVGHKDAMITSLVKLAGGYDGLNLDFEAIEMADRDAYTAFVTELATQLHAKGLTLILSVPAKPADDKTDDWSYPFDYAKIGQVADLLQLMTYDQNGPDWSDPGPVAGADWVESCLKYAASVVEPSKLLLGLGAYGYDWDLTAHEKTGSYPSSFVAWTAFADWLRVPGALEHWDATTQSPSVTYTLKGHKHEARFENARSIQAKTSFVKKYNLAGFAMYALGQEDLSFWQAARAGVES
jgi:spore germination protein YaaH